MVDLVAFEAGSRIVQGTIDLTGNRLTDTLAAGGLIAATRVLVRDLVRGRLQRHDELLLDTRTLRVVLATGPRGSLLHRVPVVHVPATVHVEGYTVHGLLHAPPVRHGLRDATTRPWLPLTDAILEHRPGGMTLRERYDALLVNRAHAYAIVPIDARIHEARWIAAADPASLRDPAWLPDAASLRGRERGRG